MGPPVAGDIWNEKLSDANTHKDQKNAFMDESLKIQNRRTIPKQGLLTYPVVGRTEEV